MKKKARVKTWAVLSALSVLLLVGVVVGTQIALTYTTVINIALGTESIKTIKGESTENTEYFKSEFASEEELIAYEQAICEQVEAEGATLLTNTNNALPLKSGAKISLFSHSSVDLMYGGTGSGKVDASSAPTLKDALTDAGFDINATLWDFYSSDEINKKYSRLIPEAIGDNYPENTPVFGANEVPWNLVDNAASKSFSSYGDAAIFVLARSGGEGADLPSGDNGSGISWINGVDGNYLALSPEEQETLSALKSLKDQGVFGKIIVLVNSSNALEMDFLNPEICGVDYGIDASMWIGDVGQTGINAVADIIAGTITPSGSLVDTFAYDNLLNPAIRNFYALQFTNAEEMGLGYGDYKTIQGVSKNYNVTNSYSVYQEGIYIGYRYYETRYEDAVLGTGNAGDFDYGKAVAYPFGYGLSYTDFEYSNLKVEEKDDSFVMTVDVTNTGDQFSGKETVQVYFQSPYTDYDKANGIEKASVELCGFGKTNILAPGKTETVTITVDKEELRTYDANGAGTYILDAGDYYFTVATDAHNAVNNVLAVKGYTPDNTQGVMDATGNKALVYSWNNPTLDTTTYSVSSATGEKIVNQFDDADPNRSSYSPGKVTWLSRSDWKGTYPTENIIFEANDAMVKALAYTNYDKNDYEKVEMPKTGADGDLTLAMMIGLDYDDPLWDSLLDQATFDEMVKMITLGFHNTASMPSISKHTTKDENGPTGLTASLTGGTSAMCYTSEDVMAATFNTDLIYEVGKVIGEDCLNAGYSGLYGPGVNIHRTAYSGRNFEYYSEDPFISGKMSSAEVTGIQEKGVYVYMKHFALNDSETYRMGVTTWVNEQAIREIYLQAFETPVVEGGAKGVMNSFSRIGCEWNGESEAMQTNILRKEWGMLGMSITDFSGFSPYMDVADGLLGGTDIWDSSFDEVHTKNLATYEDDPIIVTAMREATHRILYTVANSNAMNGISTADRIVEVTPWWQATLYGLQVVFAATTVISVVVLVKNIKRKKAQL